MVLIGRYLSPFVRRVGATLHYYGMSFEHRALRAAGEEQDVIRQSNPLGRVPVLVLDDGRVLSDSALILEYLDERAEPSRRLVPASGEARLDLLSDLAIATGATEKAIAIFSELQRPEDKQHQPYLDNCARQARDGFRYLDARAKAPWFVGERFTQLDLSLVAYWQFIKVGTPDLFATLECPAIDAIDAHATALPCFEATTFQ